MSASSLPVQSRSSLPTATRKQLKHGEVPLQPLKQGLDLHGNVQEIASWDESDPQARAAMAFDMAMGDRKDDWAVAALKAKNFRVSISLVARWRKTYARESPSLNQLMALGPDFRKSLRAAMNKLDGADYEALMELVGAFGRYAATVEK